MKSLKDLTKITLADETGKKEDYDVIGMFKQNDNTYMVYTDKNDDIIGSKVKITSSGFELDSDLTEEEYNLIDEYLLNN